MRGETGTARGHHQPEGSLRARWRRFTRPWPHESLSQPGEHAVELLATGPNQVAVVKAVRQITGWKLLPAKQATDRPPVVLATGLSAGSAEAARRVLEEAGATGRVVHRGPTQPAA
ncbi:ribosomal protein L7/L12 [Nocardioides sp. ChNu-153]|uniref:ribosomal protein L7/L12 n=1 Tax=unclassified Nocardioides TaxID=2615069 RepID=UPI0024062E98|nr:MULTISPECIES: ribosomal protein L7/L12 [unclassified Nocardioides]MDF9716083.1 ribosomal protein L7/L12 [Nocardioides sp. ChNu-99]MDN7120359.1 ribosomal protein L7/L12 [Nocardioides sp. ChNu-153]